MHAHPKSTWIRAEPCSDDRVGKIGCSRCVVMDIKGRIRSGLLTDELKYIIYRRSGQSE